MSGYYVIIVAHAEKVESSLQLILKILLEINDGVRMPSLFSVTDRQY